MPNTISKVLPFSFLLLATSLFAVAADTDGPRLHAEIVCYNGKLDSGSSCMSNAPTPGAAREKGGNMTCGFPGKVSEITWSFMGRRDGKDVYTFTRRFPMKSSKTSTQSKQIQFSGERVKVFEDNAQVIVMQSPKK